MEDLPDVSKAPIGQIAYGSANPFEIHHILCALDQAPTQPVFGCLLVPERPARKPMPCVVACHGSLGWRGHHHEHMVRWLESGIAVFRVHSFDARNVTSIVEDQMVVTHAMLLADAYRALALLSRHPLIDASRIGVSGWSLGGTVSLYAAWSPIAEALAPDGERFAAHLPLYPAAHLRPEEKRWTGAPIRVLHGADDDYTPLRFVTDLADELRPHGIEIDVRAYAGGHHSFDSVEPLTWLPNAIRLGRTTTSIDLQGDMWVETRHGERKPLNEPGQRQAGFSASQNVGAHIGGNWQARRRGLADGEAFFRQTLLGEEIGG